MEISLSAADICRIIKQCHVSGVNKLEMGGLVISFQSRRNEIADQPGQASDHTIDNVVSPINEAQADEMELMDKEALQEAEEAQMMIDDPSGFEKMQMRQHLERNRAQTQ